ncbi:hypothetical protein NGM10_09670 [Halorussus salilacus]|uniref:DUF7855 family protein n=1 Tax=Halorussus salilacus TaxID=2953750 RepID=UPI0020A071F5|nr:hypothetical protein [Halorussus salilacus]USZ66996.1 hypothetical protein NGM10_09670 [Halorussus salilacus]
MLLVVTYSQAARQTLRNVCNGHEEAVVQRFGRAVLFEATELGAFLALRLRAKHTGDVQIERTAPFNEFDEVPRAVREAAAAYEGRDSPSTPYAKFAAGTDHPDPEELVDAEL